jgi:hypothetical protein
MRTLLIAGADPVPPRLRELVDRGSTSVREQRSVDPSAALSSDFDRVVIWASRGDTALQSLAQRYAQKEAAERREMIVFVTPDPAEVTGVGLAANEIYVWPRDEDRLEAAFLTGA